MKTVCSHNDCTGCMACINVCPKSAILIRDDLIAYNAEIDSEKCIHCGLCEKTCPNITPCSLLNPIYWKQGWACDDIRSKSSSGGAASAIIRTFIENGGYVASCLFIDGNVGFQATNDFNVAKGFAGSKYVKSNPGTIYKDIRQLLKAGEKVLFIGLPCQAAAVQNVCGNNDNLFTADLICHGTPSPKILKQFIKERGIEWDTISDIKFRENEFFGVERDGIRITPRRVQDSYLRLFLNSVDYTENCYACRYATSARVSDITLGDAWGQLSNTVPGGVSLALCQTQKGKELVENTGLHLEDVDLDKAIKANHQLEHPSIKHPGREKFFNEIKAGHTIRQATISIMPKESIKQSIKTGLIKLHLVKDFSPKSGGYRMTVFLEGLAIEHKMGE